MTALEKNIMKPRRRLSEHKKSDSFDERVVEVGRVSRTVKGGRRIRFRALVVVGDRKGQVGMGIGKATEVSEAVSKASSRARKQLITVPIIDGSIPHEVIGRFGAARVMLKPASEGTSIVAGGSVRIVAELAGISDLLGKMLGSRSKINNVAATINAFSSFNERVTAEVQKFSDQKNQRISSDMPENNSEKGKPINEKTIADTKKN